MPTDKLKDFSMFSPVIAQPISAETEEQFLSRWNKFDALPEGIKDKLSSESTTVMIRRISEQFSIQPIQASSISRAVRSYYFGELKIVDFPSVFVREIGVDQAKAKEIAKMVAEKIINDTSVEQAYQSKLEQMSFADALRAYPEIGEQLITRERLKLKSYPEPVRPSIKNWLADYIFTLGRDNHSAMDRSNYLFQNPNTRTLNNEDRQKLAFILRSFDENSEVSVNKELKQIIFSSQQPTVAPQKPIVRPPVAAPKAPERPISRVAFPQSIQPRMAERKITDRPKNVVTPTNDDFGLPPKVSVNHSDENIKFSSPQTLPYERIEKKQPPVGQSLPTTPQPLKIRPHSSLDDGSAMPKNTVDLRN